MSEQEDEERKIDYWSLFIIICGLIFTFSLDFILQILGVASIWAYSEITGNRSTAEQNYKWGIVTMIFSSISLIRYILRFRRGYYKLDSPNVFIHPTSLFDYFETGFVSSFSIRHSILQTLLRPIRFCDPFFHPIIQYDLPQPSMPALAERVILYIFH